MPKPRASTAQPPPSVLLLTPSVFPSTTLTATLNCTTSLKLQTPFSWRLHTLTPPFPLTAALHTLVPLPTAANRMQPAAAGSVDRHATGPTTQLGGCEQLQGEAAALLQVSPDFE